MKKLVMTCVFVLATANAFAFYMPKQGRWVSRDPIGERGGLNLSVFVNNSPINASDKLGLFTIATRMSGPFAGYCGGWDAVRFFTVHDGAGVGFSKVGWVVQELEFIKLVFNCSGKRIRTDHSHYWEAFNVQEGTVVNTDIWNEPEEAECTQGYGFGYGNATYYNSDVASKPPWRRDPTHSSDGAPYIPIPPGLPVGVVGLEDANWVTVQVNYAWDCCPNKSRTTF